MTAPRLTPDARAAAPRATTADSARWLAARLPRPQDSLQIAGAALIVAAAATVSLTLAMALAGVALIGLGEWVDRRSRAGGRRG